MTKFDGNNVKTITPPGPADVDLLKYFGVGVLDTVMPTTAGDFELCTRSFGDVVPETTSPELGDFDFLKYLGTSITDTTTTPVLADFECAKRFDVVGDTMLRGQTDLDWVKASFSDWHVLDTQVIYEEVIIPRHQRPQALIILIVRTIVIKLPPLHRKPIVRLILLLPADGTDVANPLTTLSFSEHTSRRDTEKFAKDLQF